MSVRMIWITPEADRVIAYCARVSNPANQDNTDIAGLLAYCARHGHWSVFEMASMCIEITTMVGISRQIIRHRSFSFQEFSTRYAEVTSLETTSARRQDKKNRQNSLDNFDEETRCWYENEQHELHKMSMRLYNEALEKGVAKESARFFLPLTAQTRLYMSGTVRSWIHYLETRCDPSTQLEHRAIANKIRDIFCMYLPTVSESLGWVSTHGE